MSLTSLHSKPSDAPSWHYATHMKKLYARRLHASLENMVPEEARDPWTATTGPDHACHDACMMVTVRVADFGRAAPPSRGGGALVRAAGENFAREGVKMVIFL